MEGPISHSRPRYFAVDAARGFAVFAMVIAHTSAFLSPAPKAVSFVEGTLNDLAAPLFALIIGVTIALTGPRAGAGAGSTVALAGAAGAAGARESNRETKRVRNRYRLQTLAKAAVLIALGFALELAPSRVDIVLDYLGVTLLVAIPFLFVRTRTLVIWAGVLLVLSPGIVALLRVMGQHVPQLFYVQQPLAQVLNWLFLARNYQVVALLTLVLIGIVIGRTVLGNRRVMVNVLIGSIALFVALKAWGLLDLPGSDERGGYIEVWREVPLALGSLAAFLLLTDLASARTQRTMRAVLEPIAVQGRLSLSVYVFHVLILMWLYTLYISPDPSVAAWFSWPRGWVPQLGLVAVCWLFAAVWWRWIGAGPIERIIGVISGRYPLSSLWAVRGKR